MTRTLSALAAVALAASCGTPVPEIHRFENHGHSLAVWRAAGVRDRVVVHVDGHSDLDWFPESAVARFAGADAAALEGMEHDPYAMDGEAYRAVGIWNFLFPAQRLGIVREVIWVVPDGTLPDAEAARSLVRSLVADKMHGVSVEEATGFRWDGASLSGRAAGVPLRIVELANLHAPGEPVLLDLDMDFLTTRSAATQEVTSAPWIRPAELVARLRRAGVRSDLVTISMSTIGGFLPPADRWVGPAVEAALRDPSRSDPTVDLRLRAQSAVDRGAFDEAAKELSTLVRDVPADAAARYLLSVALAGEGRGEEAAAARREAVRLDPVLAGADLQEADARWLSGRWRDAEPFYRRIVEGSPSAPHRAYALRRLASCLARTGRDTEAIAMLREVVDQAPRHADSHMDLAVLLRDHGDLDGALAHLAEARRILPERGTYALVLGTTLAMVGRNREALEELRFAVSARPSWERAQAILAAVAYQSGLRDEAEAHIRAAMALGGREPTTRRLVALMKTAPLYSRP